MIDVSIWSAFIVAAVIMAASIAYVLTKDKGEEK